MRTNIKDEIDKLREIATKRNYYPQWVRHRFFSDHPNERLTWDELDYLCQDPAIAAKYYHLQEDRIREGTK